MLLVYADPITPRLGYTMQLFFTSLIPTGFALTHDKTGFLGHTGPKFSYGSAPLADELFQQASGLLSEKGIRRHEPEMSASGMGFYPSGPGSMFDFDLFAASFFLVSRYEEYYPFAPDEHNRYRAEDSFAFRKGLLGKPLVNIWAQQLKQKLQERYPELECKENSYEFISTFDIDVAFAYKERPVYRTLGGYLKTLFSGDLKNVRERSAVLAGAPDPYDTFVSMQRMQSEYGYRQVTFFLLADHGRFDKNIDVESSARFRELICTVSGFSDTGIHPSYKSCTEPEALAREIARLRSVLGKPVLKSRQHFLKLRFPETYTSLIRHGIREDHTMGYASACGFRAGICSPYRFYDLAEEKQAELTIYPFQVMDGTLKDYMKLSPEEAFSTAKVLIDEVRKVNGMFTLLWHNHSLSDQDEWKGWTDVYKRIVKYGTGR